MDPVSNEFGSRSRAWHPALLGFALAALVSCTPATSVRLFAPPTGPDYFPLHEGSRWTYRVTDFAKGWTYRVTARTLGEWTLPNDPRRGILVEEQYAFDGIQGIVGSRESQVYVWEGGYLRRIYLLERDDGYEVLEDLGEDRLLPETLEGGFHWKGLGANYSFQDRTALRISHDHDLHLERQTVSVPAGTFDDCIRVDTVTRQRPGHEHDPVVFHFSDWYAPGVGLVRTQQWDDAEHSRERTRIELVSFTAGG